MKMSKINSEGNEMKDDIDRDNNNKWRNYNDKWAATMNVEKRRPSEKKR